MQSTQFTQKLAHEAWYCRAPYVSLLPNSLPTPSGVTFSKQSPHAFSRAFGSSLARAHIVKLSDAGAGCNAKIGNLKFPYGIIILLTSSDSIWILMRSTFELQTSDFVGTSLSLPPVFFLSPISCWLQVPTQGTPSGCNTRPGGPTEATHSPRGSLDRTSIQLLLEWWDIRIVIPVRSHSQILYQYSLIFSFWGHFLLNCSELLLSNRPEFSEAGEFPTFCKFHKLILSDRKEIYIISMIIGFSG